MITVRRNTSLLVRYYPAYVWVAVYGDRIVFAANADAALARAWATWGDKKPGDIAALVYT